MVGLEKIYREHHEGRGRGFAILQKERGQFLRDAIGSGKKVVDIGCRDGQLTSTYVEGNEVLGVDIDSEALAIAKDTLGIEVQHADLNAAWNLPKNSFDVVVACEFLEHIYHPETVCAQSKELLVPGGMFVGTIPHAYSLQSRVKFLLGTKTGTPLEDPTHINHFSYKEFKNILESQFSSVTIVGWTPPQYRFLARFFPFLFAHDLMFVAK